MGLLWPVLVALIAVASPSFAATEPKVIAWPDLMPKTILPEDLDFGGDSASADQSTDPDLDVVQLLNNIGWPDGSGKSWCHAVLHNTAEARIGGLIRRGTIPAKIQVL
ncbi:MAG: hypothetical protein AAFO01_17130, partial [Pseudomonadota bacterium]